MSAGNSGRAQASVLFVHAGRILFAALLGACTPVEPEAAPRREPIPIMFAAARTAGLDAPPPKRRSALDDPDRMGIEPCDAYRHYFGRCIESSVPEAAREQMLGALEATWRAWTEAAIGPAGVSLPISCRAALDAARQATEGFGCDWPEAQYRYGLVGIAECDAFVRDYGHCIATRVPARRRAAMLAELLEQTKRWQDENVPPFRADDAPRCVEARAAARRATARYGCEL